MKRYGYLYDRIFTYDNVADAWLAYNANRPRRKKVEFSPERCEEILQKMKDDFGAVVGKPRIKFIREGGKIRRLQIPSFESCIAQLSLWNICGHLIERRIHPYSFSSRRGMGGHKAAMKVARFVRNSPKESKYCLYFDIRKYYQHIDKRIMMDRLNNVIKDKRVLRLFEIVLDSADEGLPIGYPFSHGLANLYLVPLYYLIKSFKGVTKVFVYMDNWTVFAKSKAALKRARASAVGWLRGVGCEMKADWQIFPVDKRPVRICGFVIGRNTMRLYRGIWRRTLHAIDMYRRKPTEKRFRSLMSRLGWLRAIHYEYHPLFKMNGGYLWR